MKRGVGRPNQNKVKMLTIKISELELAELKERAKLQNMNVSAHILHCTLNNNKKQ